VSLPISLSEVCPAASSTSGRVEPFFGGLALLGSVVGRELMTARVWASTPDDQGRMRRRMAELLVHQRVPVGCVSLIVVRHETVKRQVEAILAARNGHPGHGALVVVFRECLMGKGLALQFKQAYPANFRAYQAACRHGEVCLGRMFVYEAGIPGLPRYVVNAHSRKVKGSANRRKATAKLARAVSGQGFGEARRMLACKADRNGGTLLVADRWYPSSKLCSSCGRRKPSLTLKDRVFACGSCGHTEDRDVNAARNLLKLAASGRRG
jgi:hypothetical protein